MRSLGRWAALVSALWLGGASLAAAQLEDPTTLRARELFERGVEAYERGVYFEALQAFQDAYALRPHPAVRVNIANCYDKLDRPAEAIQHFEQFLGSGAGSPRQQQEVVQAIERLRKRVGRLVLRVSPDGARVVIDGSDPLLAPITTPVLLKPGRHHVSVSLDGYETALRAVDIQAAGSTELQVSLARLETAPWAPPAPVPPPVAAAPAEPPAYVMQAVAEPRPSAGVPTTVWVAGGVTLAALLTSIVTGQLALAADRDFNGELAAVRNEQLSTPERAAAWAHGVDAADRANGYAVATDVLLSTAIVGAVLTTVLYLNHDSDPEAPARPGAARRLRAAF